MKFSPQHLPLFIFRTRRRRRRSRRRKNELPVSYGFARPSLYYLWKQRKRYIKAHDNCPCITSANSYWHDLLNRHYRTFSPSRVRGYIKVPFFQFRYLNLLISSHGCMGRCQPTTKTPWFWVCSPNQSNSYIRFGSRWPYDETLLYRLSKPTKDLKLKN